MTTPTFRISENERRLIVQEILLKMDQTPVTEALLPDYKALLQALESLNSHNNPIQIPKFQVELLRNVLVSSALKSSAFTDDLVATDTQLPENGMVAIMIT